MRYYSEATVNGIIHDMCQGNHIPKATDYPSIEITDSSWHTGTPTKDGTFIVLWEDTDEQVERYSKLHFNEYNNTWYDEETLDCNWGDEGHAKVIAWMRIERYRKENK